MNPKQPKPNLTPDQFQARVDLCDKEGLTELALIREMKEKLAAVEVKVFKGVRMKKNGAGKLVPVNTVFYSKKLSALHIQIQALDMLLKMRGMYAPTNVKVGGDGNDPMRIEHTFSTEELLDSKISELVTRTRQKVIPEGSE